MSRVSAATEPTLLRRRASQVWAVTLMELRRLRHGRHAIGRLLLIGAPVAFVVFMALVASAQADRLFIDPLVIHGERRLAARELADLAVIFRFFDLPFVVLLAAGSLFGNLYHSELSDRTLHHIFLMPVKREIVTLGKYVAGVLTLLAATLAAWLLALVILLALHGAHAALATLFSVEGIEHVAAYALMLLLAALAYGALFLLVGALVKSPIMIAAMLWGWESLTLFLPVSFKRVTLVHWISSFLPAAATTDTPFATVAEPEARLLALLVVLAFSAACLAAATWRARRIQVSYGASE